MLTHTKSYDFAKVDERGNWLEVFVALIQYLVSGESKVGFLNKNHPWNLIHKVPVIHNFVVDVSKMRMSSREMLL